MYTTAHNEGSKYIGYARRATTTETKVRGRSNAHRQSARRRARRRHSFAFVDTHRLLQSQTLLLHAARTFVYRVRSLERAKGDLLTVTSFCLGTAHSPPQLRSAYSHRHVPCIAQWRDIKRFLFVVVGCGTERHVDVDY